MKDKNTRGELDFTHWDEPHGWFSNAWTLYDENPPQSSLLKSVGVKPKGHLRASYDDEKERG